MQPEEDIPGVLEVVNAFDGRKFARHQTRRLQEMLLTARGASMTDDPGIPRAKILALVDLAMGENKKFTRELLLELRNTLLSIQEN